MGLVGKELLSRRLKWNSVISLVAIRIDSVLLWLIINQVFNCCCGAWSAMSVDVLRPERANTWKVNKFLSTWVNLFFCSFVLGAIPTQSTLPLDVLNYNLRYNKKKNSLPTWCSVCHVLVERVVDPHDGVIYTRFSWNREFLSFNVILNKNIYHYTKNNKDAWLGHSMEHCTQTSHKHQPIVSWWRKSKLEKQRVQRL